LQFQPEDPDPRGFWNGLLYSRFQLLVLPELQSVMARRRYRRRSGQMVSWLPKPYEAVVERAGMFKRIAIMDARAGAVTSKSSLPYSESNGLLVSMPIARRTVQTGKEEYAPP
jgi:hypothetical protein